MPATYEPIATTTLGSAASSITFSSIPGTYTDLRIILVGTNVSDGSAGLLTFNSDTGANYSTTRLVGNGTTASSGRLTGSTFISINTSGGFSSTIPNISTIDIFSYAGSTNKTALIQISSDKNGSGDVGSNVGLWRNTAAITAISITGGSDNWKIGTTATLYGILKA